MKAIATTMNGTVINAIYIDNVRFENKTQWSDYKGKALTFEDLNISLGKKIYDSKVGMVDKNIYYGAMDAFEIELPNDFKIDLSKFSK